MKRSNIYKQMKEQNKKYVEAERKRYENPEIPFCVGEKAFIIEKNKKKEVVVKKVNIKTYTVEDKFSGRYRIDKLSLFGYDVDLLDGIGVTSKMLVGESVKLIKDEK